MCRYKNRHSEFFLVLTYTRKEKLIGLPFWQLWPQDTKSHTYNLSLV